MTHTDDYCVVLTTTGNQDEAHRLASALVSHKLAACVQIAGLTSYYTWKGEMNRTPEFLLLVKTRRILYQQVEEFIVRNHSYEVPEVVQIPISAGLESYLQWIRENTK